MISDDLIADGYDKTGNVPVDTDDIRDSIFVNAFTTCAESDPGMGIISPG